MNLFRSSSLVYPAENLFPTISDKNIVPTEQPSLESIRMLLANLQASLRNLSPCCQLKEETVELVEKLSESLEGYDICQEVDRIFGSMKQYKKRFGNWDD